VSTTPEIARYLLELEDALALSPAARARVLVEVEQHLTQAVEERLAGGQDQQVAERSVLRAFGGVAEVAEAFRAEAGVSAAPFTLLRRLDVWRAEHVGLGALLVAVAVVVAYGTFVTVIPLLLFPGDRPPAPHSVLLSSPLPFLGLGFLVGQLALGLAVRDRPEQAFSARVRALRLSHPRRVFLLPGVPLLLAFELAFLTSPDFNSKFALIPPLFFTIGLLANRKPNRARPLHTITGWQPVLVTAAAGVPAIVAFGLRARGIMAWASVVTIVAIAQVVQRRQLARNSWNIRAAAALSIGAMAVGLFTFNVILTGSLATWSIGIPLIFAVAFAPLVLWNFRRTAADAERARLTADAAATRF
jgi:hypothetical protein